MESLGPKEKPLTSIARSEILTLVSVRSPFPPTATGGVICWPESATM